MNELLTRGLEERLKEILGHDMKVDVAPFLFKAEGKSRYYKRLCIVFGLLNLGFHVSFGLHFTTLGLQHPPFPPFPSPPDTQKL